MADPTAMQARVTLESAVRAWRERFPSAPAPSSTVLLKPKLKKLHKDRKSYVFRLEHVGNTGRNVIAKLSPPHTAKLEMKVYEEVLPILQLSGPRFLGDHPHDNLDRRWVFIEDGSHLEPFGSDRSDHHDALADWLGVLHGPRGENLREGLPCRGLSHFLESVNIARPFIHEYLAKDKLSSAAHSVLQQTWSDLETITSHADELYRSMNLAPARIVHGDLLRKNMRVESMLGRAVPFVFDWELCGWGSVLPDVATSGIAWTPRRIDRYLSKSSWGFVPDVDSFRKLVATGWILRMSEAIHWTALRLPVSDFGRAISRLEFYSDSLREVFKIVGWTDSTASSDVNPHEAAN